MNLYTIDKISNWNNIVDDNGKLVAIIRTVDYCVPKIPGIRKESGIYYVGVIYRKIDATILSAAINKLSKHTRKTFAFSGNFLEKKVKSA